MKNQYTLEMRRNINAARRDFLDQVEEGVDMGIIKIEDKDTAYNELIKAYLKGYYDSLKQAAEDEATSQGN